MKIHILKIAKDKIKAAVRFLAALATTTLLAVQKLWAADGNAGINEATTQVKSYFDTGTNLMYAIGAIVGLVGAIKVYKKWNDGEHDTGKVASSWFGSCIFLVVVATVLKSFFGV
ncbi:MAG: carbamoyl phosphate synthetase [Mucilaginibacter sp.]|nr:carbamoyl phosphate synthetase [Mucilaginibacter sp.]